MKFTYQTAVATFIQFIAMVTLGFINNITSIISTCHHNSLDCTSNMISSLVFFMLTALWFGFILAVGYFAQKNRDSRLAGLLIGCELAVIVTAGLFNFPRETSFLTKGTSLIDVLLGLSVIYLAIQIFFARGKRIVKGARKRKTNT